MLLPTVALFETNISSDGLRANGIFPHLAAKLAPPSTSIAHCTNNFQYLHTTFVANLQHHHLLSCKRALSNNRCHRFQQHHLATHNLDLRQFAIELASHSTFRLISTTPCTCSPADSHLHVAEPILHFTSSFTRDARQSVSEQPLSAPLQPHFTNHSLAFPTSSSVNTLPGLCGHGLNHPTPRCCYAPTDKESTNHCTNVYETFQLQQLPIPQKPS